jgi:hypothetical protein
MTHTKTKEIEIEKDANGLIYNLIGDLEVRFHESPFKEENPAFQIEEVDREIVQPWLVITDIKSGEVIWDNIPTKPQLKFFNEEIGGIEI